MVPKWKFGSSVEKFGSPLEKSNRGRSIFFAHHGPQILTDFDMVNFCLTKSIVRKKYTIAINVNIRQHIQAVWRCMRESTQGKNCTTAFNVNPNWQNQETCKCTRRHTLVKTQRDAQYANIRVSGKLIWKFIWCKGTQEKDRSNVSKCNFASAQSSYLKTHMRTHMIERPFRCNQCEITYKSKGGLTGRAGTHQTSDQINVMLDLEFS